MSKFILAALLFVCGLQASAQTQEIADRAEWLRKTSFLLTGRDQSANEYDAVKKNPSDWKAFQAAKLKELLANENFRNRMTNDVLEHLGLPADSTGYGSNDKFTATQYVGRILQNGAPWSSLFNSRDVYYNPLSRRDVLFYKRIFGASLEVPDYTFENGANPGAKAEYKVINGQRTGFADALAGFFTTPDFFNRYYNTGTNENRKRAAALYRILMCDEMKPVILSDAHLERDLLMATINDLTAEGKKEIPAMPATADQHASNPECQVCHKKLEPAAKLFSTSPKSPTPNSLTSAFVFGSQSQSVIGLGQWVDAALKSDASRRCQVRYFWNYTIGKNVPLAEEQMNELLKIYDSSRENVPAMLTALILRPEFSQSAQELENRPVTISDVKPLLQRCDSCHAGEGTMPDFTTLPYDRDPVRHARWLSRIMKETDLLNMGAKSAMPPAKAGWKPTTMEYRLLAKWIADGARDERGVPSLNENLLASRPKLGLNEATFLPTFRRYLRSRELLALYLNNYSPNTPNCSNSYVMNNEPTAAAVDLGAFSFNKLAPILEVPGPAYFTWVARCLAPGFAYTHLSYTRTGESAPVKLNGKEDAALAAAMFTRVFGDYRFVAAEKELMIKRVLDAVRAKNQGQTSMSAQNLANELSVAFTSLPEFLIY